MTVFYFHLSWFMFLFCVLISSGLLIIYVLYSNQTLIFSLTLFSFDSLSLDLSFFFNSYSSCFFFVVTLISMVIMVYSYSYMSPYNNSSLFLWLTVMFVVSMLIVISVSNLFYLMLGWDGLGLISFFLIVYYQNQSSITSGIFTLLINRLGDCFFLLTLSLYVSFSNLLSFDHSFIGHWFLPYMLCLTFMTKSALYPFSSWLPIAIAAPTPISSLVHSSTLVTSGLFLIIRFSYVIYSNSYLMFIILVVSVFTSFYAGLNSLVERDLNNLIALSTLSHLGFIGMAFFSGLLLLSFFHLLTHALFNSLLFMSMGDVMTNLFHSQDIRYLSDGYSYTPFSSITIIISILNLLGVPHVSGFFSKDLVLESLWYSDLSFVILFMIYFNLLFTYFYSYQLFYFTFQSNKLSPFLLFHSVPSLHSFLLLLMALSSLFFSSFFLSLSFSDVNFYFLFSIKYFPFFLNSLFFIFLFLFGNLYSFHSSYLVSYFSNILFLTNVFINLSSFFYFYSSKFFFSSFESGSINFLLNFNVAHISNFLTSTTLKYSSLLNLMNLILFSSSLVLFFLFLI